MIKKLTTLFLIATISTTIIVAQTFNALYTFDGVTINASGLTDPTPVPVVAGITFGSFSATGTPANPNASVRFSFTDWATGAINGNNLYSSLTGTENTGEYYEVTITPASGYTIDLDSIKFSIQRSGTGIRTYAVRSSADTYVANLPASINPVNTNLSVQTGDIFFWNFDATTSNQNGSTITLTGTSFTAVSAPITFRFYGWNAEASGGSFSIDNVSIMGNINAPLTANFSGNDVCMNDSTPFTDLSVSTMGTINSWEWDFGDSSPAVNTQNPTHFYSQPGLYYVTLTASDDFANYDTIMDSVYVYDKPVAGWIGSTISGSFCAGDSVQFADISSIANGSITNYDWTFGDPASGASDTSMLQNPSHLYNTAATYTVMQIVTSDMGCKDTASSTIAIGAVPVADFSFSTGGITNFTDLTVGAISWFWEFGDPSTTNDTSILQDPSYNFGGSGVQSVSVCLTATNASGCSDSVCKIVYTGFTGIDQPYGSGTTIYPNPSSNGLFTINLGAFSGKTTVTVYNIIGKIIFSKELSTNEKETIDLSDKANGSYFMNIRNDKESSTQKITINK